jgi:hypothetical protein
MQRVPNDEACHGVVENFMAWMAYLTFGGLDHDIGTFEEKEEAVSAYDQAAKQFLEAAAYGKAAQLMFGSEAVCYFPFPSKRGHSDSQTQTQLQREWDTLLRGTGGDWGFSSSVWPGASSPAPAPCSGKIVGRERWRAALGYKGCMHQLGTFPTKVKPC